MAILEYANTGRIVVACWSLVNNVAKSIQPVFDLDSNTANRDRTFMEKDLSIYPTQSLEAIDKLVSKAIDSGRRITEEGSESDVDFEIAREAIENACLSLVAFLELYAGEHTCLLEEAKIIRESVKADPIKSRILDGDVYLTWPWKIRDITDIFRAMHLKEENNTPAILAPLVDVIANTEYYITNRKAFGTEPGSEKDVHVRIEGMLKCLYPDLQSKPRLTKMIKNFEPDTGIPCLKSLIEYKYINNLDEAKLILDQILADIGGYQTDDYDNFIFVIYETHRIVPLSDWRQAIAQSKPPNPIEIILIKGVIPS